MNNECLFIYLFYIYTFRRKRENKSYYDVLDDEKHSRSFDGRYVTLKIQNISEADQGSYSLIAFNEFDANVANLILRVLRESKTTKLFFV